MTLGPEDHERLLKIDESGGYRRLCVLQSYDSFWHFCLYMDYRFFYERREVLEEIAHLMQDLVLPPEGREELDTLNVSLPPRTGKSYLVTLFCAWCLGHFPAESIMRNTVTARLYKKFSKDLIKLIRGEASDRRFLDVFDLKLRTENVEEGWELTSARQGVSYFGAGIKGSIIGLGASLLNILDDSVKDASEALNPRALDDKYEWYMSASDSREENGCKKLFVGTRWSNEDIVGRFEEAGEFEGGKAAMVVISALDEEGESFCGAVHSTEKLKRKERLTPDGIWYAEWQQQPIDDLGKLFAPSDLRWFDIDDLKIGDEDGKMVIVDTADTGDDSLCAVLGYLFGDDVYITDVVFTKDKQEITEPRVAAFLDEHQPELTQVESNAGGRGFGRNLRRLCGTRRNIKTKTTTENKETKIYMQSKVIRVRFLFRDDDKRSKEYISYINELTRYSREAKNKHDDAADATAMLAKMVERAQGGWGFTK